MSNPRTMGSPLAIRYHPLQAGSAADAAALAGAATGWEADPLVDDEERARRVEAALQTQMDMQRRLHQQLEVCGFEPDGIALVNSAPRHTMPAACKLFYNAVHMELSHRRILAPHVFHSMVALSAVVNICACASSACDQHAGAAGAPESHGAARALPVGAHGGLPPPPSRRWQAAGGGHPSSRWRQPNVCCADARCRRRRWPAAAVQPHGA